jgi:hypothetical protein
MAKSISINLDHTFTSGRGEEETVRDALKWLEANMSTEDEDTGETLVPFTPADLVVYAVRRLRALHKDGKRYDAGKLATRYYAPRLDNLSDKVRPPRKLVGAVETIHEVANGDKPKATPKPAAPAKAAPKAAPAKAAPKAALAAKPPTVRKAAK